MRKFYLYLSTLFLCSFAIAQSAEIEPNNSFQTAQLLATSDTEYRTANIDPADVDFVKLVLPENGTINLHVNASNTSTSGSHGLRIEVYNSLQQTGLFYSNDVGGTTSIPFGTSVNDQYIFCGKAADTFYVRFTATGNFSYQFFWEHGTISVSDPQGNDDPITATSFLKDSIRSGNIMYEYRGNFSADAVDYYSSLLPVANYDSVALFINAFNTSCSGGASIQYFCYKNNAASPFASGYVGNNLSVGIDEQVSSRVSLSNMVAGDVLYIRLAANKAISYNIRYNHISYEDEEDNCCDFNAIPLAENVTRSGNVGTYNTTTGVYEDEYDTYRIVLPQDGSVKLFVKSKLDVCNTQDDYFFWLNIYDREFDYIDDVDIYSHIYGISSTSAVCDSFRYDTIKIRAFTADTFYLQLTSYINDFNSKTSYSIKYEFADPTNVGDVEPNNTTATALPVAEGETKKGHLRFRNSEGTNSLDYYKAVLPAVSTIKVYLKGTYRGGNKETNSTSRRLAFFANNITQYTPLSNPPAFLYGDSTYVDSFFVCAVPAGDAYFRISSGSPWEYEFRYTIVSTTTAVSDPEPNNSFAQAVLINENTVYNGRLRYVSDVPTDINDYYKTVIPANGTLKIIVEAQNLSCNNGNITMTGYDRPATAGVKFTKIIGNNSTVVAGQTLRDTLIVWGCSITADTFWFRMTSTQTFSYKFSYQQVDTVKIVDNSEPNNSFAEAKLVGGNMTKGGFVGHTINGVTDAHDYYKMVIVENDSLKISLTAKNLTCLDNREIRLYGYNQNNNLLFFISMVSNAVGIVDAGETRTESVAYKVNTWDTIYMRVFANADFQYHFTTSPLRPSSSFTIGGDSTPCVGPQYTYKAINVADSVATYHWSLPDGGGTISAVDSIATVTWNTTGVRRVQLYLSNALGNSQTKQLTSIINGVAPTQVPVIYNFARTLSTNSLPPGGGVQWHRDNVAIPGATSVTYYAALAGTYHATFTNDCGDGSPSNQISFPADALPQSITFPHTTTQLLTPTLLLPLKATSSSGLPVYYQVISGSATIINDSLRVTYPGNVIVKSMQPGDDIYFPATPVYDTIIVLKGNQVISFPVIPDQVFSPTALILGATSSMGQSITYSIVSGTASAIVSGNKLTMKGVGIVTVRASQGGNAYYNAATPVERSFCIGVRTLPNITGEAAPCLSTYKYTSQKIPGANFVWTLSGGGNLTTNNDTAIIQWQTPGTYTLKVKANSSCDPVFTSDVVYQITTSNNAPAPVTNMLPGHGSTDQQLPLKLSWIPGSNTVNYDLYVWDSATAQPGTPYAANINTVSYVIPKNSFAYNTTYKWRVVSKNPCYQTAGPVQTFRLIPLADLVVTEVLAPASANSGQTVTITWKVKNIGPGKTLTTQSWKDGVFFSFDTIPNFNASLNWNPHSWNSLVTPLRPLLLGTKQNVSALDVDEFYTNSISFTLPQNYSQPLYVYVITNYPAGNSAPLQVTILNDTLRAPQPINVILAPTPDLRVDSVFTPTTTFSGSTINLTYKVKNYGVVTPVGATWTDSVFISQNPLFDRGASIPIDSPLTNGAYYPNSMDAVVVNNTQLAANGTVTKNLSVVVPNFIFGTWFVYVKANAKGTLYEGPLENNNVNRSQLEVFLTPTPKLAVNTLIVPADASTTQPIGINWNVNNTGFHDNAERNKGHWFSIAGSCALPSPCPKKSSNRTPSTLSCFIPATLIRDSVSYGSSYWVDKIYISQDSTGLNLANARLINESKHGELHSGLFVEFELGKHQKAGTNLSCVPLTNNPAHYNLNIKNIINPNSNFPKTAGFNIPSDLPEGKWFVYIHTNATKTVFEYPGTAQIKRSDLPIIVKRPDLTVPFISVPSNVSGGQKVLVTYHILNSGNGAVFNHVRRDQLYVSNFSTFDVSAQLVLTKTYTENVPAGSVVEHTIDYTFPAATSGARYFYILTNFDSAFKETNMSNNRSLSAATLVSAAMPNDLVVSSISVADTVFTIFPNVLKYTVPNNGSGTTAGTWTDSLFMSCTATFNPATAFFVAKRTHNEVVPAGGSYTDSFSFAIPKMSYDLNNCFAKTALNTVYFFIKTNADTGVYEASNINNNISSSGQRILRNPLVDLTVTEVNSEDTTTVGRQYGIRWNLTNLGYRPGTIYSGGHHSYSIYFSVDSVPDVNDVQASKILSYAHLYRHETLEENRFVTIPNLQQGNYYLIVQANSTNNIKGELNLTNNVNLLRTATGAAMKIHVIRPLLPDLTDSVLTSTTMVAVGQPITLHRRATNKGVGITYPGNWFQELRLSTDFLAMVNDGDRILSSKKVFRTLSPGGFSEDTVVATIPLSTIPGNYVLISHVNSGNTVVESNNANNYAYSLLTVFAPPATDLLVEKIMNPDTVLLGYTIDSVKWVIRNASPDEAKGVSKDGIYLSKSNTLDSTALLLGIKDKKLNMPALGRDTLTMAPMVANAVEGNYNLFIKTDLVNNIVESDKENNTGVSSIPIYVKVKELPLNVLESNTLHKTTRFYKMIIPDSLLGATIKVTLKTNDSLIVRNEMYIGGYYIPSAAKYDYKFEIPNYGNQYIVMTSVTDTLYYIAINCVSPNPLVQTISLKAEKLPFAILNVNSSSGGNIGNVTVKLSGSLFRDSMTAKLSKPGALITASAVYFVNSTVAYATFNLQGKPLGVYDITLTKVGGVATTLPGSFSVVPANNGGLLTGGGINTGPGNGNEPGCNPGAASGLNSQLVVDLVVPSRALTSRPVLIQINYSNPTNFDIPAQSRILYSEAGMKMAFTRAGVQAGTTSLYLELTEPGGPPGIIRAGGSGTITVYTIAPAAVPPAHYVLFKLK